MNPSPAMRERVARPKGEPGEGADNESDYRPLTPALSPDGGEGGFYCPPLRPIKSSVAATLGSAWVAAT